MKRVIRVVDLFCGAGGGSLALRRACDALGLELELLAVNHSPVAIATHRKNHPETVHLCQSVEQVDPKTKVFVDPVTSRTFKNTGRLDLLIAGPECTHHSTARGGRPINDQSRATAWHILKWAQEIYIDNILIENVPEFRDWAPIGANHRPLKSRKGETFRAYIEALRSLGNKVHYEVYNAADHGDPTTRRRLFIMAWRGNRTLASPVATHSREGGRHLFGQTKKWRAAREIIDWSQQGQSIFTRKRPLSPKTMARVMAGLERFGGSELKPFLIVLRNNMGGRSLDEPLPTVSAGGQHMALAQPFVMPLTHGGDTSRRERSVDEPLPTITGANRGELAIVEPIIVPNNNNNRAKTLDEPLPTVTGGGRHMFIEPFVLQQQSGGVPRSTSEPLPTIATDGAQMLIEPFIVPPRGFSLGDKIDSVDQPLRTIVAASGHNFAVVQPFLVPHYGERQGQEPRTHSVDEPVPTIPATGAGKFEVVQPFIVSAGGPNVGPISTEQPMNTVLTRDHMAVVQPFILSTGSNGAPRHIDEPTPTIVGAASQTLVEPAFIASYYGTQNISPVTDPLPTITTKDRFALVMPVVDGRALDIRLRMLKPHELARAMSFSDDYQFTGNQGEQVKQIGNAWPCKLGEALIRVLIEDYATKKKPGRLEAIA